MPGTQSRYRDAKLLKKLRSGHWLLAVDGRTVLSEPLTDEPVRTGGRVTVMVSGRRTLTLGARK